MNPVRVLTDQVIRGVLVNKMHNIKPHGLGTKGL